MGYFKFSKYLYRVQTLLWKPIVTQPFLFLFYAMLLYIPELFPVIARERIEYFGGHLLNNFVLYAAVAYIVVVIGYLFKPQKGIWVGYNIIIHILVYIYSIGDLICVKLFSTRYTAATITLIFQSTSKSTFVDTYLWSNPVLQIYGFYFVLAIVEIFLLLTSFDKVKEFIKRWWRGVVIIYSFYVIYLAAPYFGNNYADAWTNVNWYGGNRTIKDNTLWQLNIGIRKFLETKTDINNIIEQIAALGSVNCKYDNNCIVLIIGESYNKRHAHFMGCQLQTTPEIEKRNPIIFTDVIAPSNLTNASFKNFLSPTRTDDSLSWCQAPLFPLLFKKSGYNVAFFSAQFVYETKDESAYTWHTASYLNHPEISNAFFSHRNNEDCKYDNELVESFASKQGELESGKMDLIIFHLDGQHFNACDRYPNDFTHFTVDSIANDLPIEWKQRVAEYDNATLYNDMVVSRIVDMYSEKDAIVIYFSDHADEVCDCREFYGRAYDFESCRWDVMHNQLDIPFLIFASDIYREKHPDIMRQIEQSTDKSFMIDDLSHLLFYLGGIETEWYQESRNILSDKYDTGRHRMVSKDGDVYNIDYDFH